MRVKIGSFRPGLRYRNDAAREIAPHPAYPRWGEEKNGCLPTGLAGLRSGRAAGWKYAILLQKSRQKKASHLPARAKGLKAFSLAAGALRVREKVWMGVKIGSVRPGLRYRNDAAREIAPHPASPRWGEEKNGCPLPGLAGLRFGRTAGWKYAILLQKSRLEKASRLPARAKGLDEGWLYGGLKANL